MDIQVIFYGIGRSNGIAVLDSLKWLEELGSRLGSQINRSYGYNIAQNVFNSRSNEYIDSPPIDPTIIDMMDNIYVYQQESLIELNHDQYRLIRMKSRDVYGNNYESFIYLLAQLRLLHLLSKHVRPNTYTLLLRDDLIYRFSIPLLCKAIKSGFPVVSMAYAHAGICDKILFAPSALASKIMSRIDLISEYFITLPTDILTGEHLMSFSLSSTQYRTMPIKISKIRSNGAIVKCYNHGAFKRFRSHIKLCQKRIV